MPGTSARPARSPDQQALTDLRFAVTKIEKLRPRDIVYLRSILETDYDANGARTRSSAAQAAPHSD